MMPEEQKINLVVSIGSNSGNRRQAVAEAIEWLLCSLQDAVASTIYETPPYGSVGPSYMNAVVKGDLGGGFSLQEFEKRCKSYELTHGRDEEARKEKRVPIDIDIVIADGEILRPSDFERRFFRIGYNQL